ncbi:MAG: glycosyltransferase [Bacteroidales bacterium]|nr:glycosyltransferase [Bacteroidales bacterium]MBN2757711.1 glycosyltransferase [Bacteroidales bacterium]
MIKVINIINHPPAYDGHRDRERPKINWDLPNGTWVGIWGYEWHNIIGNKVLEIADDIEYEVWQPDLRADKIYQHKFENGLLHRLFPAKMTFYTHGIHIREDIFSETLMTELDKEVKKSKELVLHINAGFRFINIPILNKYYNKISILGQFYTNSKDIFKIPKTKNVIKLINTFKKNYELKKYYNKFKYIIPSIDEGTDFFEKKFGIKVFHRNFANFGRDFNDWKKDKSKSEARTKLNIDENKFVMFSSSRLIPIKQIDKMLIALSKVNYNNFICYISGRGTEEYEKYLNNIVVEHKLQKKVKFIGYVDFDVLKDFYQASDLLISTSLQDAGPEPVSIAAAMGLPALITETGIGFEFYKQYNVGLIVPVDDYNKWTIEIDNVINGKQVQVPSRENVDEFSDWKIISEYYYNIYKKILKK